MLLPKTRQRVLSLALLLTLLLHKTSCQEQNNQERSCSLSELEVLELVDSSRGRWNITDAVLEEHNLQEIVDCTREGDSISLQTTTMIQPSNRIVIPWRLTIGRMDASDVKASMTCPGNDGLFLIKVANVTFRNLIIEGCDLSRRDRVAGIIETDSCPRRFSSPAIIHLHLVDFVRNSNLGGSVGLTVEDPSCYNVRMHNVAFRMNQYARGSELSLLNDLRNIDLVENEHSERDFRREHLLSFPQNSQTSARHINAANNRGGVLSVMNGTLDVSDSVFTHNSGTDGAAIAGASSFLSLSTSTFDSNFCNGYGGAVFLSDDSNGTFFSVQFANNFASEGGAIYSGDGRDIQLVSSIFESNSAEGFGAVSIVGHSQQESKLLNISHCIFHRGGGLYLHGMNEGIIHVDHLEFSDNFGAFELYHSENVTLRVKRSVFDSNHGMGAASFGEVSGRCSFRSTQFTRNRVGAFLGGGAISIYNPFHVASFNFHQALFQNNEVETDGGAVFLDGAGDDTIRFIDSQFLNNKASSGGAIYFRIARNLVVQNCTFVKNSATEEGGAIRTELPASFAVLEGTTFRSNSAGSGGALYSMSNVEVMNCTFERNKAQVFGGAADLEDGSDEATFVDCAFTGNRAVVGGAVRFAKAFATEKCHSCRFHRNQASLYGGGVYMVVQDGLDYFELEACNFTHNRAIQGGGAFFQVDPDDFIFEDPDVYSVFLTETSFVKNHAERAGGAYFVDAVDALYMDCNLTEKAPFSARNGFFRSNFKCDSMKGNSVGEDGYGANVASGVTFFFATLIFENGTSYRLDSGTSFAIHNWRSGDTLPIVEVIVVDHFHQGPALTRSKATAEFVTAFGNGLAQYTGYAKATIDSFDGLIPNPLITDVSDGKGNLTVGGPIQEPGDYSLVLWLADDASENIVVHVTLRGCIINEAASLNDKLCAECDSNQFNFHPEEKHCSLCPVTADCSSPFILPLHGQWNSFPCSERIEKCINSKACKGSNATEVLEMLEHDPLNCEFSEEFMKWYGESLCEEGYSAALCGSCTESSGRVGTFTCRKCLGRGAAVFMVILSFIMIKILVVIQIKGNLDSADHRVIHQVTSALNQRSRRVLSHPRSYKNLERETALTSPAQVCNRVGFCAPPDSFRNNEKLAKWKFVELLKVTINFLQTVAAGVSLDVSWDDSISGLLTAWDWIGGATMESSSFSLDCLLPTGGSTPRSITRQALVMFIPVFVLLIMAFHWTARHYRRKMDQSYLVKRCILTAVVVFYVSYISLTRAAINTFYCVDVFDGTTMEDADAAHPYWALDTAVRCFKGGHMRLVVYVALPVVFFTFVFPISLAVALINARRKNCLKSCWVLETVGLLYRGFDERFVFWDSVILLRKALLAAIVVFAYSLGGNLQGLLAGCLLMLSLILHMAVCPFKSTFKHLNQLEGISLLVSSLTFFCGVIMNDPMMTSRLVRILLLGLVLFCNVGLTLLLLCMLLWVKAEQIRFSLLADGVECELENGFAVVKAFAFLCMDNVRDRTRKILTRTSRKSSNAEPISPKDSIEIDPQNQP